MEAQTVKFIAKFAVAVTLTGAGAKLGKHAVEDFKKLVELLK